MTPCLDLHRRAAAGRRRHRGQSDRRLLGLRRAGPLAARQRRLQDGLRPADRRPLGLELRRLAVRLLRSRSARSTWSSASPTSPSWASSARFDVRRELARHAAPAQHRRQPRQAAQAHLGARPALQDALPALQALHLRRSALRRRLRGRHPGRHHGRRRRLHHGPGHDLPARHADLVVVGTSLFQIIFVTANVTFLQAYANQTVDVVLALLLLIGAVIGAQIGAKASVKLRGEQLRILLAIMVLAVCFKLGYDLTVTPVDLYSRSGSANERRAIRLRATGFGLLLALLALLAAGPARPRGRAPGGRHLQAPGRHHHRLCRHRCPAVRCHRGLRATSWSSSRARRRRLCCTARPGSPVSGSTRRK